jgi:hypothetical protein
MAESKEAKLARIKANQMAQGKSEAEATNIANLRVRRESQETQQPTREQQTRQANRQGAGRNQTLNRTARKQRGLK